MSKYCQKNSLYIWSREEEHKWLHSLLAVVETNLLLFTLECPAILCTAIGTTVLHRSFKMVNNLVLIQSIHVEDEQESLTNKLQGSETRSLLSASLRIVVCCYVPGNVSLETVPVPYLPEDLMSLFRGEKLPYFLFRNVAMPRYKYIGPTMYHTYMIRRAKGK